jgi:hypothetical protein
LFLQKQLWQKQLWQKRMEELKRIFEVLKKQPDLQTYCNSLLKLTLGWVLGTTVLVPQVRRVALRFRCCQCLLWWGLQVVIGGGCHFSKKKKNELATKVIFKLPVMLEARRSIDTYLW